MEILYALLVQYSIGLTVGFIILFISRKRWINKSRELEDIIRRNGIGQYQPTVQQQFQPQQYQPAVQPQFQPQQQYQYQPQPVSVAQPVAQPQAAPIAQPVVTEKPKSAPQPREKQKFSAIGIAFAIGVLLLIIGSAVFLTASWQTLTPIAKCAILGGVVAVTFIMSAISKVVLKIEKTSSAFYILGSLLMPVTITAGYLSYQFDNVIVLLLLCSISLLATGILGYFIFKSRFQLSMSYFGLVWSIVFISTYFITDVKGFLFGLFLSSFIVGVLNLFIGKKLFDKRTLDVFAEVMAYISGLVFWVSFVVEPMGWRIACLAMAILAFSLVVFKRKFAVHIIPALIIVLAETIFYCCIEERDGLFVFIVSVVSLSVFYAAYLAVTKLLKILTPMSNAYLMIGSITGLLIMLLEFTETPENASFIVCIPLIVASFGVVILSKFRVEKAVYWGLTAISVTCMLCSANISDYVIYAMLGIMAASLVVSFVLRKFEPFVAFSLATAAVIVAEETAVSNLVSMGVLTLICLALVLISKRIEIKKLDLHIMRAAVALVFAVASFEALDSYYDHPDYFIAIGAVIAVAYFVVTLFDVDKFATSIPSLVFAFHVGYAASLFVDRTEAGTGIMYIFAIGAVVFFCVLGRIFYKTFISQKHVDFMTIYALGFVLFGVAGGLNFFTLLGIYIVLLIGRFGTEEQSFKEKLVTFIRPILASAVYCFAFALIFADIDFSEYIDKTIVDQLRLLVFVLASFIVCFIIRIKASKWIWLASLIIALEIDLFIALDTKGLLPLSVVCVIAIAMFVFSMIKRRKAYLIAGSVCLIESAVGLSFVYWESKLWWVYLHAAGAILITLASVNEYKRRKAIEAGEEDKKIKLFEKWSW